MAQSNTAFALLTLGQWCRNHGIYEVRDVLAKAAHLAEGAESSELLSVALEEAAIADDVPVCPAPTTKQAAEPQADEQKAPVRGKRRARVESGKFQADDPATPDVNEAWQDGAAQADTTEKD